MIVKRIPETPSIDKRISADGARMRRVYCSKTGETLGIAWSQEARVVSFLKLIVSKRSKGVELFFFSPLLIVLKDNWVVLVLSLE